MPQQYKATVVTAMDSRFLIGIGLFLGLTQSVSADTPESFFTKRWYNIEFVVFEKVPAPPTSELVTNAVEKRLLPADTIVMQLSDEEIRKIGDFSDAVNFDAVVDELFFDNPWHVPPTPNTSSSEDEEEESESKYSDGCWLHLVGLEAESTNSLETRDDWSDRFAKLFEEDKTRDPRLPDWLPDVWQTFDQNFIDSAKALGLCEEDVSLLLDQEYLDFLSLTPYHDPEELTAEEKTEMLTAEMVHDAFEAYERELNRTALTPQSNRLNLQQTANRLANNGYQIIDHYSWHQDGQARGSEPNVLVQFGQHFENGFREVEGTVAFSVARFLHLRVNLWRFVSTPQSYDPSLTEFQTPVFFYEIQESRRIALGEVHYFDHPKFGVLVQIRRVSIPDRLKELVEQLNSSS